MNTISLKCLSAAAAAVLLAGCASTGDKLDAAIGQPADQLVQALGQPDADFRLQNGQRILKWQSWSTRKEPRYPAATPRMSYARSEHSRQALPDNQSFTQAAVPDQFSVQACVVWVQLDDDGIIQQGKAHGSGC